MVQGISRNITYHYVTTPDRRHSFYQALRRNAANVNFPIPDFHEIQTFDGEKAPRLILHLVSNGKHVIVDGRLFNSVHDDLVPYCSSEMESRIYDLPVQISDEK